MPVFRLRSLILLPLASVAIPVPHLEKMAGEGDMVLSGGGRGLVCPCGSDMGLAPCANLAAEFWMKGEMDIAILCMDYALTHLKGSPDSREAAKLNLKTLYQVRIRASGIRYYHGYEAKQDWIFPPLQTSKGLKDRSIRYYKDALPPEFCDYLINLFERDKHLQYPGNILGKGISKGKKNMEIDISDPTSGEWADIDWYLVQKTTKYLNLYEMERSNRNLANTGPLGDEGFRMKRYQSVRDAEGGNEFHTWHSDGGSESSCYRALAVVFYLNDVDIGGETVFLTEGINIKPSKGAALIWPTGFNYVHAGLAPVSGPKYIITNFLRYTASRIFKVLDIPPPQSLSEGKPSHNQNPSPEIPPKSSPESKLSGPSGEGKRKRRRRRRRSRGDSSSSTTGSNTLDTQKPRVTAGSNGVCEGANGECEL